MHTRGIVWHLNATCPAKRGGVLTAEVQNVVVFAHQTEISQGEDGDERISAQICFDLAGRGSCDSERGARTRLHGRSAASP